MNLGFNIPTAEIIIVLVPSGQLEFKSGTALVTFPLLKQKAENKYA